MTRRSGMSLTEVLVALFVMALGTISILTLFPLASIQMGQALKDDRTSQAAIQADAYMRWYWQMYFVEPINATKAPQSIVPFQDPNLVQAFFNPTFNAPVSPLSYLPITAAANNPSYPVVVDPMGAVSLGSSASWMAPAQPSNLTRRNLQLSKVSLVPAAAPPNSPTLQSPPSGPFVYTAMGSTQALRTCSLMDGLGYDPTGLAGAASGVLERDMRYNWLWVLQIPDTSTSHQTTANMTVVVFDRRVPVNLVPGSEQVFSPVSCTTPVIGSPPSTVISFPAGSAPPVQKGGWLLDATVLNLDAQGFPFTPQSNPPHASTPGGQQPIPFVRNANFYRVVSVTQNGATVDVELQTPLVPDTVTANAPIALNSSFGGQIPPTLRQYVFLSGVSEVFQRPMLP